MLCVTYGVKEEDNQSRSTRLPQPAQAADVPILGPTAAEIQARSSWPEGLLMPKDGTKRFMTTALMDSLLSMLPNPRLQGA